MRCVLHLGLIGVVLLVAGCGGGGGGGDGATPTPPPPAVAVLDLGSGLVAYHPSGWDPANAPAGAMVFVRIPAMTADLGTDAPRQGDEVRRQVSVAAYWLAATEMTQAQWTAVAGTTPWTAFGSLVSDPALPACGLSRDEVVAALATYSRAPLALPTGDQWEAAARAGSTAAYAWGDGDDRAVIAAHAWSVDSGATPGGGPATAGTRQANPLGLRDLEGNVAEFTADGAAVASLRGGAWTDGREGLRLAARWTLPPNRRHPGAGVRLVLSLP